MHRVDRSFGSFGKPMTVRSVVWRVRCVKRIPALIEMTEQGARVIRQARTADGDFDVRGLRVGVRIGVRKGYRGFVDADGEHRRVECYTDVRGLALRERTA